MHDEGNVDFKNYIGKEQQLDQQQVMHILSQLQGWSLWMHISYIKLSSSIGVYIYYPDLMSIAYEILFDISLFHTLS